MRVVSKLIVSVISVLLILSVTANADENSWSTNGPCDARVVTIAIHPFDNQTIYLGTIVNGIYLTTNGGTSWDLLEDENEVLEETMREIRIHPIAPETLYASTTDGVFKSSDGGASWIWLNLPYPDIERRPLEIHPEYPNLVFTGDWSHGYKSEDGGNTWEELNVQAGGINAIEIDPVNNNVMYVGIGTSVDGHSIYKSLDYGETWFNVHNNLDSIGYPEAISVSPINPDIVYYSRSDLNGESGRCVYKSINGGESWQDITPPGLIRLWAFDVLASPIDQNTVYVCTHSNGVFRSRDGGQTWQQINEGRLNMKVKTIKIDATPGESILYIGTYNDGIWRSLDDGDTWEKISDGIKQAVCRDMAVNWRNPDTVYAATHNGLYMSPDGADTWQHFDLFFPDADDPISDFVAIDPVDASMVYLSYYPGWTFGQGGVYRTLDGGANWEVFTNGLPANNFFGEISIADYGDGLRRLYLRSTAGLYYSDDFAEHWQRIPYDFPPIWHEALTVSPVDPELVLVGTKTGQLFKSEDGGESWGELTGFPFCDHITEIFCDPSNPDVMYITLDYDIGLYKSIDGGESWFEINNNLPQADNFYATGLAINPYNTDNLFIFSSYNGVYQSHNGGEIWEPINDGLSAHYSKGAIRFDPVDTTRLYFATWGHSVWSITRTPTSITDDDALLPTQFTAYNYPNPFNASTSINFALPRPSDVTVDIYDMLGRRVSTIVNEYMFAGYHSVVWDPKGIGSGMYLYRINAGEYNESKKMILLK